MSRIKQGAEPILSVDYQRFSDIVREELKKIQDTTVIKVVEVPVTKEVKKIVPQHYEAIVAMAIIPLIFMMFPNATNIVGALIILLACMLFMLIEN